MERGRKSASVGWKEQGAKRVRSGGGEEEEGCKRRNLQGGRAGGVEGVKCGTPLAVSGNVRNVVLRVAPGVSVAWVISVISVILAISGRRLYPASRMWKRDSLAHMCLKHACRTTTTTTSENYYYYFYYYYYYYACSTPCVTSENYFNYYYYACSMPCVRLLCQIQQHWR